jgi:AcrR family transcriptional regulator
MRTTSAESAELEELEPRWRRRKDARPQEILAAALDLFIEKGYAATRADEVASRAGVSKGTVYLYFDNKEELFKAVVRQSFGPALQEAIELVDHYQGSSFDLLDELMHGWWQHVGATKAGGIMKLMMAEAANFPEIATFYHEEVIARSQYMIVKVLERGMTAGEFRKVDPQHMVHVMVAPMVMLIMWQNSFARCTSCGQIDTAAHIANTVELLKRGLVAPGAVIPASAAASLGTHVHTPKIAKSSKTGTARSKRA